MSLLSNKITSYTHERGIEFNQAYTLTPTRTGTATNGTFTLANTTPVFESTVGPIGGAGSWKFKIGNISGVSSVFTSTTANAEYAGFTDGLFTMGFWFMIPVLPTGTGSSTLFETATAVNRVQVGHVSNATAPSKLIVNFTGSSIAITSMSSLQANRWYFFAVRRFANATNSIQIYLDGTLIATQNQSVIQTPSLLRFGGTQTSSIETSFNISNYFHGDPTIFTATAISEIWTVGSTTPVYNQLKYWNGSAWTTPISKSQWNGSSWVTFNGKIWDGSTWSNIT